MRGTSALQRCNVRNAFSTRRRLLGSFGVCCLILVLQIVPKNLLGAGGSDTKTYSHDARGLEKQNEPLLKSYAKGNPDRTNKEYAVFILRNANQWFADYFPASNVQQWGRDYEAEAENYKRSPPGMMKILQPGGKFQAHCSPPDPNHKTKLQPSADAPQPTKEIPIEQFEIRFVTDGGKSFSILGNFVYVDGAYRYLGKGAYPFWSMPDATRK